MGIGCTRSESRFRQIVSETKRGSLCAQCARGWDVFYFVLAGTREVMIASVRQTAISSSTMTGGQKK